MEENPAGLVNPRIRDHRLCEKMHSLRSDAFKKNFQTKEKSRIPDFKHLSPYKPEHSIKPNMVSNGSLTFVLREASHSRDKSPEQLS